MSPPCLPKHVSLVTRRVIVVISSAGGHLIERLRELNHDRIAHVQNVQVGLDGGGEVERLVQDGRRQRPIPRFASGSAPVALPFVLHAERAVDVGVVSVGEWMGGAVVQLEGDAVGGMIAQWTGLDMPVWRRGQWLLVSMDGHGPQKRSSHLIVDADAGQAHESEQQQELCVDPRCHVPRTKGSVGLSLRRNLDDIAITIQLVLSDVWYFPQCCSLVALSPLLWS